MKGVKIMSEFEKAVRIALIRQGKSCRSFANELGISVYYFYALLKGRSECPCQMHRIKRLLGLDMESNEQNVNQSNSTTHEC
jgi:hypothetical protein